MDLSKYATLFLAESREHLKACNSSLLEWEKEPAGVEPVRVRLVALMGKAAWCHRPSAGRLNGVVDVRRVPAVSCSPMRMTRGVVPRFFRSISTDVTPALT